MTHIGRYFDCHKVHAPEVIVFVLRNPHVVLLLLVLGWQASAADGGIDCGKLLRGLNGSDTIYVSCTSLSGLSKAEALSIVESVLRESPRRADDTRIIFLSDPSVLDRDWQYQNMEKRLESWGDAFVGMYHTNSGLLMYRSSSDGKWRNIELGIS